MKNPSLEEVKEHFKDAKVVKCLTDNYNYEINIEVIRQYDNGNVWCNSETNEQVGVEIWDIDKGYAEIIEYKSNTKPKHYKTDSIDVIDFCKIYDLNFNMGNIVKYACRKKNQDIEDLQKIIDYAERELKHLKKCNPS